MALHNPPPFSFGLGTDIGGVKNICTDILLTRERKPEKRSRNLKMTIVEMETSMSKYMALLPVKSHKSDLV